MTWICDDTYVRIVDYTDVNQNKEVVDRKTNLGEFGCWKYTQN
ncbi:MAG: hypothetical protein ABIN67_01770 [Ferruginibacter sp.]